MSKTPQHQRYSAGSTNVTRSSNYICWYRTRCLYFWKLLKLQRMRDTITCKFLWRHPPRHHDSTDARSALQIMIIYRNKDGCAMAQALSIRRLMAEGQVLFQITPRGTKQCWDRSSYPHCFSLPYHRSFHLYTMLILSYTTDAI